MRNTVKNTITMETTTGIRFDRLKQLADHLLHGKLAHKRFDFRFINAIEEDTDEKYKKNKCGTMGCAIGECPAIWPENWSWKLQGVMLDGVLEWELASAEKWFGIDTQMAEHLFLEDHQHPELYGGKHLGGNARKSSVAKNILAFIEKMTPLAG